MVQLIQNGFKSRRNVGKIHHPTGAGIGLAPEMDFHTEGMAVHLGALVASGNTGQMVGRVKFEYFINFHF
jgi:hypothetical protein